MNFFYNDLLDMGKKVTTIILNSINATKNTDGIYNYSFTFDTPPITINNNAILKVANWSPTAFANYHGDAIYSFKIRGVNIDYGNFISNENGYPSILSTTFNNSRNVYEENEIVLTKQTINSITLDVDCLTCQSLVTDINKYISSYSSKFYKGQILTFNGTSSYAAYMKVDDVTDLNTGTASALIGVPTSIKMLNYGMGYTATSPTSIISSFGTGAVFKVNMIPDPDITGTHYKVGSIDIISGGSLYVDGQPIYVNKDLVNEGQDAIGSGCVLGVPVLTGSAITSIPVTSGGTNYIGNQRVTITGGTFTKPAIAYTSVVNGVVQQISIMDGGNYSVAPTAASVDIGIPAVITAIAPQGEIIGVNILLAGSGYTSATGNTCGVGGNGAALVLTTSGTSPNIAVSSIGFTNRGYGYINGTVVTFTGGTGTAALYKLVTNPYTGEILNVSSVYNGAYSVAPTAVSATPTAPTVPTTYTSLTSLVVRSGQIIKGIHPNINFSITLKIEEDTNNANS